MTNEEFQLEWDKAKNIPLHQGSDIPWHTWLISRLSIPAMEWIINDSENGYHYSWGREFTKEIKNTLADYILLGEE